MTPADVYKYFDGNWSNAMRKLGKSKAYYQHWLRQGYIRYQGQLDIERKTNGRLKANIADDLRKRQYYGHVEFIHLSRKEL